MSGKIKVKLLLIWGAQAAWQEINSIKKPVKTAYALGKFFQNVFTKEANLINDQQRALIMELGDPIGPEDPEGRRLDPKSKGFQDFNKRFTELLETEIEITPIMMTFDAFMNSLGDDVRIDNSVFVIEPFFKPEENSADKKAETASASPAPTPAPLKLD